MTAPYREILDRIEALAGDPRQLIYDPELNRLLEPLRTSDPIRVRCGNYSCRQPLGWWALDPQLARVWSVKRRLTKKESKGLGGIHELHDPDPHPLHGFELPEREAMGPQRGRKKVALTDHPGRGVTGIVTRRKHTCGKCGRQYPRTNETMLRDFVRAARSGSDVVL